MLTSLRAFRDDESGAALAEYGLLVALIAAVCVAVVKTLGGKVNTAFNDLNGNMP